MSDLVNFTKKNNEIYQNNEKQTKTYKKKKAYKCGKNKELKQSMQQQKQYKKVEEDQLLAILRHQPVNEHKYFIRGDLVIDFEYLREGIQNRSSFFCLNNFRPARNVQYKESDGFYEVHFESGYQSIYNFSFIIDMLNSIGSLDMHQVAQLLENYQSALNLLDKTRHNNMIKNQSSDEQQIQDENYLEWNFDNSLQKANKILKSQFNQPNEYFFYIISKGYVDYSELGVYGINENSLKMVLGNLDHDSTVKILLQNGLVLMNENFMDVIQMKLQETMMNLNSQNEIEPEFMTFNQKVQNITINNHRLDLTFIYEKYRLSNYSHKFNDTLILARIDESQKQSLMNQLFIQKLLSDSNIVEEKELLSDITYQAQSEYFIEKFYKSINPHYYGDNLN